MPSDNKFSYQLTHFKSQQESSLDIKLANQEPIDGFQLLFLIEADPNLEIIDQDPNQEYHQLQIGEINQLNFLTNRAKKTSKGWQIELAAITSNPTQPLSPQNNLIARLNFTQPQSGTITIKQNGELTSIATTDQQSQSSTTESQTQTIKTQPTGNSSPEKLTGQLYSPPANNQSLSPTTSETRQPPTPSSPIKSPWIIASLIIIILGITYLFFFLRSLKKTPPNQPSLPPKPQPTPPPPNSPSSSPPIS